MNFRTVFSSVVISNLVVYSALASNVGEGASSNLKQAIAAIQYEAPNHINYLSVNQNHRLSPAQGLSFDTLIPQVGITENTYFSGFARINNDEQHLALGLRFGKSELNLMAGQGAGFSRLKNQYSNVDPYYFHGGTTAQFQFNNIELAQQFGANTNVQIGQAHIRASNLADRYTHYIGGQTNNFLAHYMQVSRDDVKVGEAFNLGFDVGYGIVDWSMLKQTTGGEVQHFSFSFKPFKRSRYGLALSQRQNPLLDEQAQYRMMLSFSRPLGGYRMGAAETPEEGEEESGLSTRNTALLIGGGAVVAALALSSGSDSQDNSPRSAEQHEAARGALNRINPVSVRLNREHGGWVYQTLDGRFASTKPVIGGVASVNIPLSLIPEGGQPKASYHTHAGPDPRYLNEQFSPADFSSDNAFGVDGYLGTPAGNFLFHQSGSSKAIRLGSIAN